MAHNYRLCNRRLHSIDDWQQLVQKLVSTSFTRLCQPLSTTKTISGKTNTKQVVAYTTEEDSTVAPQTFRPYKRRMHSIDDWYIAASSRSY